MWELLITPQKRVLIGILITGIITATITTLAVTNVLNLAAAQIQFLSKVNHGTPPTAAASSGSNTRASSGSPTTTSSNY
jgi:hypothetical protein